MAVIIPQIQENGEPIIWKPMKIEESLLYKFETGGRKGTYQFINKSPTWDPQRKIFEMNFYGRVTMPSIKNFQLVNYDNS